MTSYEYTVHRILFNVTTVKSEPDVKDNLGP